MSAQVDIPNSELRLAEELVRHTGCHIFLTGRAGTGKTTFLHTIQKRTHKRMVVTAPTGVAAINAGGVTLHSFFQLPFGPFIPGGRTPFGQHRIRREKKNLMKSLDLLVIDEISMVRADLLDGVDSVLRRYRRSDAPFGGVQLLMIGDLQQLSPVVKDNEWQILQQYYESPYFFSSTALGRTEMIPIELKHIYRQSDPRFIDLLGRVRDNRLDPASIEALNSRHFPDFSPPEGDGYITLCTHNSGADALNEARLRALRGKSRVFHAEVEGNFPEQAYPTAATLEMKTGAQVMFVRNDLSAEKRYFNGKIGEVTGISTDGIEVRCPGDPERIQVEKSTWENIEYAVDPETAEISQRVIGTFSQYPLKPAWAITIHKSQGLTFDRAIIDAQAAFAHGQVYVALSRCRSFEGMVLSSPLGPQLVKTDPAVQRFARETAGHAPSPEKVAMEKCRYQQRLVLACFTFERLVWLLGRFTGLLRGNARSIQVSGGIDIQAIQRQASAEIFTVAEKFKRQLQGMFRDTHPPASDPSIRDRLTRASGYFQEKFEGILTPPLESLEVESDNKEIRKKIRDIFKQLREETAIRRAGVKSCQDGFSPERYLRALSSAAMDTKEARGKPRTVTYSEAEVGHPELFETLQQWRKQRAAEENVAPFQVLHQKTLVQIAVILPDSLPALKRIKGIGPRLAERYGAALTEMVTAYRREHGITEVSLPEPSVPRPRERRAAKEDTREVSLALFQKGHSISGIAAERNLAVSTIEGHLAHFVTRGELKIGRVLPDEKRQCIEKSIAEMPGKALGDLKRALGADFSYGEIKLVLAYLGRK